MANRRRPPAVVAPQLDIAVYIEADMPNPNIYADVIAVLEREIARLQQALTTIRALAAAREFGPGHASVRRRKKRKIAGGEARAEYIASAIDRGVSPADAAAKWKIRQQRRRST
jgi:hypothetical protein